MTADGGSEEIEGRGALVFRRELDGPAARAWTAVTRPAGLAAWFPGRLDGDLATSGAGLE